jgi:two-component system cell cycle sensor histidine kinase/response regulator CckA
MPGRRRTARTPQRTPESAGDGFRQLFAEHPTPTWVYDPESLAILEMNDAALGLYGYARGEIAGLTLADLRVPFAGPSETGETRLERHRTRQGTELDLRLVCRAIELAGEIAVLVTSEDVSRWKTFAATHPGDERLGTFIESAAIAITVSRAGVLVYANPKTAELLGFDDVREALGRPLLDFIAPSARDAIRRDGIARSRGEEVPLQYETLALRKDGTEFTIWVGSSMFEFADGPATISFLLDITRHKRAYHALRLSEDWLRLAADAAQLGFWRSNMATGDLVATGRHLAMYGFEPHEQPTVQDCVARIPEGDLKRISSTTPPSEWGEGDYDVEHRVVWPDGSVHWLSVRGHRSRDETGQAVVNSGAILDITERKRVEAALRQSEERLLRAASAGQVGLWEWDVPTHVVYFSPEWKRQIGYEDHEITGGLEEWQSRVHPDDLERVIGKVNALVGAVATYEMEFRFRHKDGSYRHILARGSRLLDEQGRTLRIQGSHVDISDRVQLQAQLLQAQKMESIGRLAGGIAHDFNNLITVVNGMATLASKRLRAGDPLQADLNQIVDAGNRAARLTQKLLAFSRRQVMKTEVLNLNTVMTDVLDMLRRLLGETIELAFAPGADLGNVRADATQIEQVVLNLVVNARDAMPGGGAILLETRNVELNESFRARRVPVRPGPYVMVSVRDTGVGMDATTLEQIFEPFFTTKEPGEGTGLGLSTVYGIVQQMGGAIAVDSAPGEGTVFTIYLPQVAEEVRRAAPARTFQAAKGTETILVVEDDDSLRTLAQRILSASGYRALVAANGTEAIAVLDQHEGPVHLLLTDMVMPGMSGRGLALVAATKRPEMAVLYTSGYTEDESLALGMLDGSTTFLGKPYSVAELTQRVREVLDSR